MAVVDDVGGSALVARLGAIARELAAMSFSDSDGVNGAVLGVDELKAVVEAGRTVGRCADGVVLRAGVAAKRRWEGAGRSPSSGDASGDHPDSGADSGSAAGRGADDGTGWSWSDGFMDAEGGRDRGATSRREAARVAVADLLPLVGAAAAAGRIGPDQLDSIARAADRLGDRALEVLNTAEIVERATIAPADTFDRWLQRHVARLLDDETRRANAQAKRDRSSCRWWIDRESGMGKVFAELDPERWEAVTTALQDRLDSLAGTSGGTKGPGLAADALVDLITNATGDGRGSRSASRPHLIVVVDRDGVGETGDGAPLAPEAVRRLGCDAVVRRVVLDNKGVPVDVGRAHRTATSAQWAALRTMYSQCGWEGCTAPISWCQAHHIHFWEHDGPTDLCNLIPLCSRHHHRVHDQGWGLRLRAEDRRLEIYRPDRARGSILVATTWPDRTPYDAANQPKRE